MSVDRDQVTAIAALARLRLGEEELTRITDEMNQVLGHVETLKGLDVADVPVEDDPLEGEGDTTRSAGAETPDTLGGGLDDIAPETRDHFFLVPPLPGVHAEDDG